MRERPTPFGAEPDPYWNSDELLSEARFHDREFLVRLQAHVVEEPWQFGGRDHELIPLHDRRGRAPMSTANPTCSKRSTR